MKAAFAGANPRNGLLIKKQDADSDAFGDSRRNGKIRRAEEIESMSGETALHLTDKVRPYADATRQNVQNNIRKQWKRLHNPSISKSLRIG
ncbi:hypothetical protein [Neisseria iguanae]|uniref:Uncharacterized protein n=1 Tax=Neisseria iguanae TaxID=90242 RepID=A0A2P7TZ14_9NEIS|nr:hypothetical protein [Neisseria iguanae]PSJ79966.1 hypothetical protein C7N83_09095 [Neisseria iguanae]